MTYDIFNDFNVLKMAFLQYVYIKYYYLQHAKIIMSEGDI